MKKYNPKSIEAKWQKYWQTKKTFVAKDVSAGKKKFVLVEFPYPSGAGLHMGHMRGYTAGDVTSRYWRLRGQEVLFPIGWDAFGLPAENYAIKTGVHPKKSTAKNISNFIKQINSLGYSFDWSRAVDTTDPEYYKWTQWIFLQLYKAGLAYEATAPINWCPKDKTGLANEEVINGACERCGTPVEKREMRQWYLKITAYAEKLLKGLTELPEWPDMVKTQQENWIGRSVGAEIQFPISNFQFPVTVFTTRPDTIFGATYLVVAPEHKIITDCKGKIANWDEVQAYVEQAKTKDEMKRTDATKEKTGVELKGVTAMNPATKEVIPVWVADYVLGGYGTGAIMAVPAHDERDFAFASKFHLPIKQVIEPVLVQTTGSATFREHEPVQDSNGIIAIIKHWEKDVYMALRWPDAGWGTFLTGGIEEGMTPEETVYKEILEETGFKNAKIVSGLGTIHSKYYHEPKKVNRFGHAPTYYVELQNSERVEVTVEEKSKHEVLWLSKGELKSFLTATSHQQALELLHNPIYSGSGLLVNSGEHSGSYSEDALLHMAGQYGKRTVQYKLRDWLFSRQRYWGEPIPIVHCEQCGIVPVPEKDLPVTLPPVKKYEPTGTGESPLAAIASWVNTKCPQCKGPAKRETNTMPQWAGSSWYWLRYADPKNKKEFASKAKLKRWTPVDIYFGGMEHTTLHLLYSRFWNLFLYDKKLVITKEPYTKRVPHGIILAADGEKMSKSRGNVVNPDELVKQYGADTTRMYELFLGPHEAQVAWNDKGIIGVRRFLDRVWGWCSQQVESKKSKVQQKDSVKVERAINKLTKKVGEDIEAQRFNTCISALMEFLNEVKDEQVSREIFVKFLTVLYPFAPHIAEELHAQVGGKKSLQLATWPKFDPKKIVEATVEFIVQINGKMKDKVQLPLNTTESEAVAQAKTLEKVHAALDGATIRKTIFVPNRLVNFVL